MRIPDPHPRILKNKSVPGGCHHPHPSPPSVPEANIQREVLNSPGQIATPDLARTPTPKFDFKKKSKKHLVTV
jgi:hypothetical protein